MKKICSTFLALSVVMLWGMQVYAADKCPVIMDFSEVESTVACEAAVEPIVVTTAADTGEGSLRAALNSAVDGDVIEFNIAGTDVITLASELSRNNTSLAFMGTTVTINGINKATGNPIVLNGDGKVRIFNGAGSGDRSAGVHINFNNLIFRKGYIDVSNSGGACTFGHSADTKSKNIKFDGCTFEECFAGNGGAISAGRGVFLTIENCTFVNNKASGNSGAVNSGNSTTAPDCSAVIINSTFYGNEANDEGGAVRTAPNANTSTQIINCTFVGNKLTKATGTTNGGGVFAAGNSGTVMINCIVAENVGDNDVSGARIELQNCIVGSKNTNVVTETNPVAYVPSVFYGGVPVLKNNGGLTKTIAISKNGAAFKAGIAELTGFVIPTKDQRGVERLAPPCIGALDDPKGEITVTSANGGGWSGAAGTLGHALRNAGDGEVIVFNVENTDIINITAPIERRNAPETTVTILGINQATGNPIVLDGDGKSVIVSIGGSSARGSGISLNFNNLIFRKAYSGSNGGAVSIGHSTDTHVANVKFDGCTFEECSTTANGGAINTGNGVALVIENCSFINNKAGGNAGAISTGNSRYPGNPVGAPDNSFVIRNSTFYGNEAKNEGGALNIQPNAISPAKVINCTFVGNKLTNATGTQGGAIFAAGDSKTTLVNCIVAGNIADNDVYSGEERLTLQNCIVEKLGEKFGVETGAAPYAATIFAAGVAELKDNGGLTKTIAISNDGAAFKAGIASLEGFVIPTVDQRGFVRLNPPCIGAFDDPTESGKPNRLTAVSSQALTALAAGKQIKVVSENPGWVTVYNLTGNMIDKVFVSGNETVLPTELIPGIYLVRLIESAGNISAVKVLIK